MNKVYNVEGKVQAWLKDHANELYADILLASEESATRNEDKVLVCSIRSITGITSYVISNPNAVVESLKKAEAYFVTCEEYEKAARARDCGMVWEDKAMIYNKNNHKDGLG